MTAKARKHFDTHFAAAYQSFAKQLADTPMSVLVWGPGKGGGDLYEKRLQIRDVLRVDGCAALFSEEIDILSPLTVPIPAHVKEYMQALVADAIVILQASPGSTAEVHDFAHHLEELGPKMMIFIDERHQKGYSYMGMLSEIDAHYGNVHTYKYPADIVECHLCGKVQHKIQMLRAVKWRLERHK